MTQPWSLGAYEAYLEELASGSGSADHVAERTGAPATVVEGVTRRLGEIGDELVELSHVVHAHPELAFEEQRAAAAAAETITRHDVAIELGVYGLDTAFRAVVGDGPPRVAILAEYDALPGIGHGCGHNIICASAIGGFLAAAELVGETGGSVELIGTPAEEGGSGKELIARAGGFDRVDCAMMIHPGGASAAACTYIGMRQVDVVFRGQAAHASAYPYMGRNALDACVSAYTMIAQLRQHMLADERIHGVITDGGDKPNIVPARAAASYFLRSGGIDTLLALTERVDAIFQAAAAGTGTEVDVQWDVNPMIVPVRNNITLASRFARALEQRGLAVPLRANVPSGSTDMGNVSVRIPSIHPKIAASPPSVAIHTAEFAAYAGSPSGDKAVLDGAFGLAVTALDYLADPAIRDDASIEFAAAGGVVDVAALAR